jgi:altronate dehydratase
MRSDAKALQNCDGVVALAHTEAALDAGSPPPKNWDLLLRTLSGFVSHPNAAAVLVVGYNSELLSPEVLRAHMESIGRPLPRWCRFLSLSGEFEADLAEGKETLKTWLPQVNQCERTEQPLKYLSVALQCGGSDAFSGTSGNPSAGVAAKMLIENGGNAVLAETDELMGAESYILSRVGNIEIAKKFLHFVGRFKERFSWHGGQSAESNPSDGNKLRGLYNIALKSLGAAKKKHAEVSLDGVIDYGERIPLGQRGYYFLDSPGNDLESIAGQVASGCNAIFFVTGNGSITNFPFVPTIKIITTTDRYRLLERDMDFNAGRFQTGELTMPELGAELFNMLVRMASGERSLGERAGHSQISIWREWAQTGPADPESLTVRELEGTPIAMQEDDSTVDEVDVVKNAMYTSMGGRTTERLGLVLPTALCSGEVSRLISEQLNANRPQMGEDGSPAPPSIDRFISLPHTEGCGIGYAGDGDRIFSRIMLGHLLHPNVAQALMMEHGCEKTHNAWMLKELADRGIDASRYGVASLQLDGGIAKASEKVHAWFEEQAKSLPAPTRADVAMADLPIAVIGEAHTGGAAMLAAVLSRSFVGAGGTVVVPGNAAVFRSAAFLDEICGGNSSVKPSLAFAQLIENPGMHIMDVPAGVVNRIEVVTGLVACGVGAVVVVSDAATAGSAPPVLGSPVVPVLHIVVHDGLEDMMGGRSVGDLQLGRRPSEDDRSCRLRWMHASVDLISRSASLGMQPRSAETFAFQIARGPTGVSA